jgi:hypothetical protein
MTVQNSNYCGASASVKLYFKGSLNARKKERDAERTNLKVKVCKFTAFKKTAFILSHSYTGFNEKLSSAETQKAAWHGIL